MAEENPVEFDKDEYPNGLNSMFLKGAEEAEQLHELYKERFENTEHRDIAAHKGAILEYLQKVGLAKGATVLDLGSGTGLFVESLAEIVGKEGKVLATEISEAFVSILKEKCEANEVMKSAVEIIHHEEKKIGLPTTPCVDVVLISDVYHHLTYPKSIMSELYHALKPEGRLVLIDFHRDSNRHKSHPPGWIERHVRADQDTFRGEILSVGFSLVEEPDLGMFENYCMCFSK